MADPSTSSAMWAVMLSWLTPSSLFLFLNLTIVTIVLSHRFNRKPQHDQLSLFDSPQIFPTPSLLERVRSINFSHYNFQPVHSEPQQYPTPDNPTGLVRTPSFLERVRSISFPHCNFQQPDPEPQHVTQYPTPDNSTGLVRTPSLLARLKSMDFSSLYRPHQPDQESEDLHPTGSHDPNPRHEHLVHRSKSDTGCGASENRPEKVMKKSTSEKSALGGFEDEDEGVDAKADDFINRFKQQLKLQRLDSLLRYRETLKRN